MEGKKDVFTWLLLECTGDSEDKFEHNVASEDAKMDVEEDDAHSSCCDHFMVFDDLGDAHDKFYHVDDSNDGDDDDGEDYNDDDEEEEEVSSRGGARLQKKARLSADSIPTTMVLMNDEMEKSRLFWEACLAS